MLAKGLRTNVLDNRWEGGRGGEELFNINFNNEKGTITKKRAPQKLKSMKSKVLRDTASGISVGKDHLLWNWLSPFSSQKKHYKPAKCVISKL
jgi:hypothetical protein